MLSLNQITASLLGLPTIGAPYSVLGFVFVGVLAVFALLVSSSYSPNRQSIDRNLFWVFGFALVAFAILRPIGLARDDLAYVEIVKALCTTLDCSQGLTPTRDYAWYYLVKLGLPYWPGNARVALVLSGLGVIIKLFVIDRLCRQRLLALLLFIPLSYVQYDLTQLRAGLAISWMMLGIYWLVESRPVLGSATLFTNFAVHSQAVFSPGLLTYRLFGLNRWLLPVGVMLLLAMLYVGLFPSAKNLDWLGAVSQTSTYYEGFKGGGYVGVRVFPIGYLFLLGYGVWLCNGESDCSKKIVGIVSAGLLMGVALSWFFAIIPTMQTRLFEFYAVPLVFLAGNVGSSQLKIAVTIVLSLVLYLRLELLHDWILG